MIGRVIPGNGSDPASPSTASFSLPERGSPGVDRHFVARTTPGPNDLAIDEHRTRPDTRSPELTPLSRIGYQQLTFLTLKQEVGVATGEEAGRCVFVPERGTSTRRRRGSMLHRQVTALGQVRY